MKSTKTRVELVSYIHSLPDKQRIALTLNIINASTSDIILFSGHTIGFVNEIEELKNGINNKKSEIILELENIGSGKIDNCLYRVSKGELKNMFTNQLFTTSEEIEQNYPLGERFLTELVFRRQINIHGLKVLVIQCGELNILKNIQDKNNKVEFRLSQDKYLASKFKEIINQTDIFLNPQHTPMGNQGKLEKRRIYLSKKKRYYFSTSNSKKDSTDLSLKSMQYAFNNGKPMQEIRCQKIDQAIIRSYEFQ